VDNAQAERQPSSRRISRREVLTAALGGATGLLVGIPLIGALIAPLLRPTVERVLVEAGRVDDLPPLEPRAFRVPLPVGGPDDPPVDRQVFAVRGVDGNLVVLLNECTHLGCRVEWLPARRLYYCPCHRGYFNVMGYDVNGPPPRPMYRLVHQVQNGVLFVSNEREPDGGV
jgi:menaquinol-cytochrome c reductase iron-sulfur subunit